MPVGKKLSSAKVAASSTTTKKLKETETKKTVAEEAAKKAAAAKKTTIKKEGEAKKKITPKKHHSPKPIDEENKEGVDDKYDAKKSGKVHYTHDEKRHMKYIRNKIRDGVELTEDEITFATAHNIELSKAKTASSDGGGFGHDKKVSKQKDDGHHKKAHGGGSGHGKDSAKSKSKKH